MDQNAHADQELRTSVMHPALQNRLAIAGVSWKLAVTIWLLGLFTLMMVYFLFGSWHWYGIGIVFLVHSIIGGVNTYDPCLFINAWRYWRQAGLYDPWPHARVRRNPRPEGFGRDGLC